MKDDYKTIVFDLDETLGYFTELGIFWTSLQNIFNNELNEQNFVNLLDTFPEFIRPNILNILNYIKNKKLNNQCYKVLLYTNNQAVNSWANYIIHYFNTKLNYNLFDQIIRAFKIQGKQIEPYRTSHQKKYSDLMKCSKLPNNAKICFLDDQEHEQMIHENIYYIHLKPYIYKLPYDIMISRYYNKYIDKNIDYNEVKNILLNNMKQIKFKYDKKDDNEFKIDNIISKRIIEHLNEFFS